MKYFINQIRTSNCGFTCLKMLLASIYKDENYLYLDDTESDNCSFLDLVNIAKKFDMELKGVKCQDVRVAKTPFIAHVKTKQVSHFVVVKKVTKKSIAVLDPAFKLLKYKIAEFNHIYQGNALVVNSSNRVFIVNERLPSLRVNLCFRFLSMLALLMALSFINKESQFYLSLSLFLLCAIISIFTHANIIKIMKSFDKKFILDDANVRIISELKTKYFTRRLKLFNSLMTSITIAIILTYNEPSLVSILMFIAMCTYINNAFTAKYFRCKYVNAQLNNQNIKQEELLKSGYLIANFSIFIRALIYFVSMSFLLIQMEVLKVVSLNYFIFYFGALILFLENINNVISMYEDKYEERRLRCLLKI